MLGLRADTFQLRYRLLSWLVGAAALALAHPAHADGPRRLELTWTAPAACPTQAEVTAAVERLLANAPRSSEPLRSSTRVDADGSGFTAQIAVRDGDHERLRTLHGDTCKAVADATAVVLALAIDPNALIDTPAPPSTPLAPVPSEPAAPPAPAPPVPAASSPAPPAPPPFRAVRPESAPLPQPPPRPSWRPRVHARLQGAASAGALPGIAPRLVGGLEASWGVPRLVASVDVGLDVDSTVDGASSRGGSFALWTVALDGCAAWIDVWPGELGGCLGGQVGRLRAASFGVETPGEGSATWLALEAGARSRTLLTDVVALDVDAFVALPLRRPTFVIEGRGDVYQPSVLGGRVAVGLSYAF